MKNPFVFQGLAVPSMIICAAESIESSRIHSNLGFEHKQGSLAFGHDMFSSSGHSDLYPQYDY
jgi:hypothetical protein